MKFLWIFCFLSFPLLLKSKILETTTPPKATKKDKVILHHGDKRVDSFYWLREKENPEVIKYLNDENTYTQHNMEPFKNLTNKIFNEMISRLGKQEDSYPYKMGNFKYFSKYKKELEYPIYYRTHIEQNKTEEIINPNLLSKDKVFFNLTSIRISPDEKRVGFLVDTTGRNFFTLFIKDLQTGIIKETDVKNIAENFEWANDNETIFYSKQDPETLRWEKIFRYSLNSKKHTLILHELDEKFWVNVRKSKTNSFLFFESEATLTSETLYLDADAPKNPPLVFSKRKEGHFYKVFDGGDAFLIKTNLDAPNYRLSKTDLNQTSLEHWVSLVPHRKDTLLETIEQFKNFIVMKERKESLISYNVLNRTTGIQKIIPFTVVPATPYILENYEFDSHKFRFSIESLSLPETIYEHDMENDQQVLLKQKIVGGNYDSGNYTSLRMFAPSRDGKRIPLSIVHKKGLKKDGSNPTLIYAYGAYGDNINPYFEQEVISLLDRGFIYVVANVRGGSEMGQDWYDDGKMLNKKNSFYDFIDVTNYLISNDYTSPKKVYAWGESAGGLLVGTVINMRPDLYKGVYAQVPFVDTLTTMLDPSIPLTIGEYDEWGNPEEKSFYDYIKTYSPYDNIKPQNYPHIYVTAGFHDSQVQYWEPAKWVAKLRETKLDNNLLLLHTDMNSGHGGASGRTESLKQLASGFSFLISIEKNSIFK